MFLFIYDKMTDICQFSVTSKTEKNNKHWYQATGLCVDFMRGGNQFDGTCRKLG